MPTFEWLYGRNAVRETLRAARRRVYRVYLAAGIQRKDVVDEIVTLAGAAGVSIQEVDRARMDALAGDARHHGVMAEVTPYPYVAWPALLDALANTSSHPLVLILDYIQDPQNLGTLVRAAEGLAVDGIVIPERRAAGITAAVVNASAGATEHMPIVAATNLVRAMGDLKARGLWLAGLEQTPDALWHTRADLAGPLGLVIGSEGKGMSRLVRESCDFFIQLPMLGQVNSLNAAVAGSVALYEIWRQRAGA
jgi:23S rRNA (guanosine2251-2'-O)-methyltransferase